MGKAVYVGIENRRGKQTITINIINFNMFEGEDYHTEAAAMIKGKNEVFSDKFCMHFFELKKIGKNLKTIVNNGCNSLTLTVRRILKW